MMIYCLYIQYFLRWAMKVRPMRQCGNAAMRRRERRTVLATPTPVVESAMLMELLMVDVTLEGNRRPSKVARLQTIGAPRVLAQLARPSWCGCRPRMATYSKLSTLLCCRSLAEGLPDEQRIQLRPQGRPRPRFSSA